MNRWNGSVILTLIAVLFCVARAQAQITTATIYGNVTDPSGASVAGAEVTATNELTGAVVSGSTNEVGEFTLTFLPVGRYTIAVKAAGFKEQKQTALEVTGGQRLGRNIVLVVGEVTETVSVTAETHWSTLSLPNSVRTSPRLRFGSCYCSGATGRIS